MKLRLQGRFSCGEAHIICCFEVRQGKHQIWIQLKVDTINAADSILRSASEAALAGGAEAQDVKTTEADGPIYAAWRSCDGKTSQGQLHRVLSIEAFLLFCQTKDYRANSILR